MNKKFLLLPLTAITASVYAGDETHTFITLDSDNTALTNIQLQQIAAELEVDVNHPLIKIPTAEEDSDTYQIQINAKDQINALAELAKLIKSTASLKTFNYFGDETQKLTSEQILKHLNMKLTKQEPTITYESNTQKFTVTPKIAENTEYQSLDLKSIKADISIKDIYQASTEILPVQIKNKTEFLNDYGEETIELTDNITLDTIKQAIIDYINNNKIDISKYNQIKKPLQDPKHLPQDLQAMQFKYKDAENIDQESDKVKLNQVIITKHEELTKAKQLLEEKEQEIKKLQQQLQEEQEKPKKTEYKQKKAAAIAELADLLEEQPSLKPTDVQKIIDTAYTAIPKKTQDLYQKPTLLRKSEMKKEPTIQPTKQDKINNAIAKTALTPNLKPINSVFTQTNNIKFGPAIQETSIDNFNKLYQQLAKKLKQPDPTKWTNQAYQTAIKELITQQTIATYGLVITPGKNFAQLFQDINTFNDYQKTKYVICYNYK